MKTVIIGGGKGCRAIIDLARKAVLKELPLEIQCVVDVDVNAPGMVYARTLDIKTTTDMNAAMMIPGVQLVIELTGQDSVLDEIYHNLPAGMRVIDHNSAHVFWDLVNAQQSLEERLDEILELEEQVEQERRFLQSTFDTIPDLVVVLDPDKKIVRVNASFSRLAGISARSAMGKSCADILGGTELAIGCRETAPLVDQILETGLPRSVIWQTAEPHEAYWEVSFTPILDENLEIDSIVVIWHRITEEVRLRREIESAEQKFRSLIDSAHDWISMKDNEGRYVIVNPVCAESFHLQPEDFIGKRPEDIFDDDRVKMIEDHDKEAIENNLHQTYDEIFEIDGRERHYQTVRFPIHDYSGKTIGVCTIARDTTAERELHEQLVQAEKLAAVGKLAAGVAHEINNPLTGVLAFAEDMLEELKDDDPHRDDLDVIIRETMRCREIVRNLLDFARQDTLQLEEANPNDVVEQSLSLVKKLPQFRNITLHMHLDDDIPPILCDTHQMQQVLLNLMINASDAMGGSGTVMLSTTYDREHNRCLISVQDSGPGISENMKERIFEPFFSTKGTNGLGLAVSWSIVERHRGTIEIESPETGGAIFHIILSAAAGTEQS
jgi:PAS domain S-box-containing protein